MAQQRVYSSSAERQKAFRERQKTQSPAVTIKPSKKPRLLSRPKRLEALQGEAEALLDDYTAWKESLPENLQEGASAEKLDTTIEALEQIVELLSDLDPPRGFGRD